MSKHNISKKDEYISLVPLRNDDINQCMALDKIALNRIWSKKHWETELSDETRLSLGLFSDSHLIAMACGSIVLDEIQITLIAVHPVFQRKGFGKLILSRLLNLAKEKKVKKATLEVDSKNHKALHLYKSLGFKTHGFRSNYYQEGSDAQIQWKFLE